MWMKYKRSNLKYKDKYIIATPWYKVALHWTSAIKQNKENHGSQSRSGGNSG